tara:strand:- start:16 stop:570 length:555 start_codon:yes stop_codon:yes gene_type:complete
MGLVYIATATASSSSTLSFTSGIDDTYNEYQFHFVNMHPADDDALFHFQVNAHDGSSQLTGFNEAIASTGFSAWHNEGNTSSGVGYEVNLDQGVADQTYQTILMSQTGNDADQSASGILTLYDPANTTHVKHWTSVGHGAHYQEYSIGLYFAGYIDTTYAITQIDFKFDSGNIDAGSIHMYGVG